MNTNLDKEDQEIEQSKPDPPQTKNVSNKNKKNKMKLNLNAVDLDKYSETTDQNGSILKVPSVPYVET